MSKILLFSFSLIVVLLIGSEATTSGDIVTFFDKGKFLTATRSIPSVPIPDSGGEVNSLDAGPITYTTPSPSFATGMFSIRIPGNVVSVTDLEDLDVAISFQVFAYGFDFHEPEFDPNIFGPFVDSTFTVELFSENKSIASFSFNAPNDTPSFVGFWSDLPFDRIEIRETVGGFENEFFGQTYLGKNEFLVGDINCDSAIDLLDVAPFVQILTDGEFARKADMNGDGAVNLLDVNLFIRLLTN